jgi:hypothetical protein
MQGNNQEMISIAEKFRCWTNAESWESIVSEYNPEVKRFRKEIADSRISSKNEQNQFWT